MVMRSTEADFEPADMAQWTAMVERILKGAAPDSLDRIDEDGLVTHALYPVDATATSAARHLPAAPHARLAEGWQVLQTVPEDMSNADILDALASGATGLVLTAGDPAILEAQLAGVIVPAVAISLDGAAATPAHYRHLLAVAGALDGAQAASTRIDLGLDPVEGFAAGMELHAGAPISHCLFRSDGWHWHNRGVTAAQELGIVIAGCAAVLRAADAAGEDMVAAARRMSARIALPADMFAGIAICRATRRLWDGLLAGCGIDPLPLPVSGHASLRMMSVLDSEVNMLRMTTALLGGAIGGADAMAGYGHDLLTGESVGARRMARLAQVMMIAESHIAASLDPAAGAPFVESRTAALADEGWRCFQQIEQAGGLAAARAEGLIAGWAGDAADARDAAIQRGGSDILGATLQPRSETVPALLPQFADIRRPAAMIEDIRRAAAANTPRVLILRSDDATQEGAVRSTLAIAGLAAVTLPEGDAGIETARPDWVIGCGVDAPPTGIPAARFLPAGALLHAGDRLAALARLAGREEAGS